ncbi:MAG: protein-glutamate O-methyltransferase CheR [Lachnoclostridium sp.]|jgi:chemotaxis protein methyltransferase CheR|nr:protein-glutamate O-methyltransferase CheR [Lachnoclostridium sp.]
MNIDNYEKFKEEFLRLSKIDLNAYKENQMKRRINSFITKYKFKEYTDFFEGLKPKTEIFDKFVTFLTINVSEFYRNPTQWRTLENDIIPYLTSKFGTHLRIWSAACSTGDEPYSLAMVLKDMLPNGRIEIIATDLDKEVLGKAEKGYYTEKSVKDLPDKYKKKYLIDDGKGIIRVKDEIRRCIKFKEQNLLKDPYPNGLDMIVCRNVLIYFTESAKSEVYHEFAKSLKKGGILFVGSTEQVIACDQYGFDTFRSFFYRKE